MHIHFVIPAYQESRRLPAYLEDLLPALGKSALTITLQVVDDGSSRLERDRMEAMLRPMQEGYPFFLPTLILPENLGKGGAVYSGWENAPPCDLLAFVDADGSIPADEVIRLTRLAMEMGNTALFGSRVKMLGRQIARSALRHYVGRAFATLTGILLQAPVYDSQCGIKIIPQSAYRKISTQWTEYGFAFDLELLLLLNRHCPIIEIPIDWHDRAGSKVHLLRDGIRMILTLLRLRKRFLSHHP